MMNYIKRIICLFFKQHDLGIMKETIDEEEIIVSGKVMVKVYYHCNYCGKNWSKIIGKVMPY